MTKFRALVVEKSADGKFSRRVTERSIDALPAGDVLIDVRYSSLNYKDGLSATGNPGVTRNFPHTPGIDAAGTVLESASTQFKAGDEVIVIGFDLGMNTSGGFGQRIRVPAGWIVPRPAGLETRREHDPRHRGIHRGVGGRQARSIGNAARRRAGIGDWCDRRCRLGCGDAARAPRIRSCRGDGQVGPARLSQGASAPRKSSDAMRCARARTVRC